MVAQTFHPYAFTMENAARFSGLSRSRLYELMATGQLKAFKIGSRRMILHEELKALLDNAASAKTAARY